MRYVSYAGDNLTKLISMEGLVDKMLFLNPEIIYENV
jgi:hypothetical protein